MFELPLFPLNTVLFPGVPIFLNIFEPRYKSMLRYCVDNERPFGVVLIKQGVEAHGEAVPHEIGCTARIAQTQVQENGNIHLVAVGEQRFRILALEHDRPYLVGQVMGHPMEPPQEPQALADANRRLVPWLERYVELLGRIGNTRFDKEQLPDDALSLGYIAAYLLQIPVREKQQFLVNSNPLSLLTDLRATYRRETAFLRAMLDHADQQAASDDDLIFSLN